MYKMNTIKIMSFLFLFQLNKDIKTCNDTNNNDNNIDIL
jgi:hypothetical protein